MKVSAFMTQTGALIYVKCCKKDQIIHLTTDTKFLLYHHIRKEIPNKCILFDTRRDLEASLAKQNYFI